MTLGLPGLSCIETENKKMYPRSSGVALWLGCAPLSAGRSNVEMPDHTGSAHCCGGLCRHEQTGKPRVRLFLPHSHVFTQVQHAPIVFAQKFT